MIKAAIAAAATSVHTRLFNRRDIAKRSYQ
jgi:hypothetical protein